MNPLKDFVIQFVGLKNGCHEFEYKIGNEFFDEFDYSIIKKGNLDARLVLDKRERMLVLHFTISGTVELICDRCLAPFDYPMESHERQVIKLSEQAEELTDEDEEIVFIGSGEHEINVAPFIYEFTHLALPMISLHPDRPDGTSACDPKTLAALEALRTDEERPDQEEDPRWEALKKLRNN